MKRFEMNSIEAVKDAELYLAEVIGAEVAELLDVDEMVSLANRYWVLNGSTDALNRFE